MKKLYSVLALSLALVAVGVARPASAQTAEGWLFAKQHDFFLSAVNLGTSVYTVDKATATFTLFNDFEYHIDPNHAVGALVNIGFGDGFTGFDFGPQYKYKFKIGSTGHVPYVRGAIPLRILLTSADAFGVGSVTQVGLGLLVGGGYRYWFHRRVGVGADLSLVPTFLVSGAGSFVFGLNFSAGVEVKF